MKAYYNEFDKKKCAALKQLMADGHISKGEIDDRSIRDVSGETSRDTTAATSSRASASGTTLCSLLDGKKIDPFGQVHVPASHSALPADKKVRETIDTYGLNGSGSSASVALQQSLENRLLMQLPKGGLTMFIKGWKRKSTPLGRLYCQLAVSARPTGETDCCLWATPKVSSGEYQRDKNGKKNIKFAGTGSTLGDTERSRPQGHGGVREESMEKGRQREKRHTWSSGIWIDCPDGKQRLVEPGIPLLGSWVSRARGYHPLCWGCNRTASRIAVHTGHYLRR